MATPLRPEDAGQTRQAAVAALERVEAVRLERQDQDAGGGGIGDFGDGFEHPPPVSSRRRLSIASISCWKVIDLGLEAGAHRAGHRLLDRELGGAVLLARRALVEGDDREQFLVGEAVGRRDRRAAPSAALAVSPAKVVVLPRYWKSWSSVTWGARASISCRATGQNAAMMLAAMWPS